MRELKSSMFIDTAKGTFEELRPQTDDLSRRQFEAGLERLLREHGRKEESPGSLSCEKCRRCVSCMFCKDCEECFRCTHCVRCSHSSNLTHCVDCTALHDCAYCVRSDRCTRSNYVVLSTSCSECTYCFGCVGLSKVDFHILYVSTRAASTSGS